MSHTSSVLSEAAHPSTATFAGGKGAPNQERARKNPTGTAATPFFGRAELGATRASLQLRRGKGEGLRPLSQPPNTPKIQCQGKVAAEKVQEVTPQSRISGLFCKDVAAHCTDGMQEFHLPLCYREKHPGKQERCKGKGLGSWRVQGGVWEMGVASSEFPVGSHPPSLLSPFLSCRVRAHQSSCRSEQRRGSGCVGEEIKHLKCAWFGFAALRGVN